MMFLNNIIEFAESNIINSSNKLLSFTRYAIPTNTINKEELYPYEDYRGDGFDENKTLEFILNDYESFFKTSFNRNKLTSLFNSYIIPSKNYEKIMCWVIQLYNKLYPWVVQPPNRTHHGHIGGIYERVMGYAISQEELFFTTVESIIHHNDNYKRISY